MAAQFSAYGQPEAPGIGWTPDSGTRPRDGFGYGNVALPLRSMSYSGETIPGNRSHHYAAMPHAGLYDRRASNFSDMYATPVAMGLPGVDPGAAAIMDPSRALSGVSMPPTSQEGWQQHQQQLISHQQYQYAKQGDSQEGWIYGENGEAHQIPTDAQGHPMYYQSRQ